MRIPHSFAWAALFAITACVGPLDNPSTVHDLRILGIAVDPPEITYPTVSLGDAGPNASYEQVELAHVLSSCTKDFSPIANTQNVTLTALVADPGGNGRSLHYVFTGCPQTYDEICPDGGGYWIGEGYTNTDAGSTVSVSWPLGAQWDAGLVIQQNCAPGEVCEATPLLDAFAQNTQNACRFAVWYQIGLEVDAPDGETIFGSTIMVFTPVPDDYPGPDAGICPQGPDGGPPPHVNPQLEAFDLDGQALPLYSTPQVSASLSHTLRPIEPSNGPQPYCLPNYTGGWSSLTETWLYSAMTTVGQFDNEQVGGRNSILSSQPGPSTALNFNWSFPDGGVGLTADLYEITRDGRGGTSWLIRHAAVTP